MIDAFKIFKEVYDKGLNIPICYEYGVALASLLCLRNEVYDEIVADCNRNKDNICSSAKIVLKYLIDGEIEGCLLYTSPSPRDGLLSRMPSSA